MGLKKNVNKTVRMVCYPCREAGVWAEKDYTWRMTGVMRSYRESQRERVNSLEGGKYLEKGSLAAHRQTHHGVAKEGLGQEDNGEGWGNEPRTYRTEFPAKVGSRPCPFQGCSGRAATCIEGYYPFSVTLETWLFTITLLLG